MNYMENIDCSSCVSSAMKSCLNARKRASSFEELTEAEPRVHILGLRFRDLGFRGLGFRV